MATRKASKSDITRRQLLDAALQVIGEKGYSAATVDEIVKAAGVSKGVVYYHFENKAAIAESVLDVGVGEIINGFERICEESESAESALVEMINLFANAVFENVAFGRFLVGELWRDGRVWSDSMRIHEAQLLTLLRDQLERGQQEGAFRPELDPGFEAVAIVGMVLTVTLYYVGVNHPFSAHAGFQAGLEVEEAADDANEYGENDALSSNSLCNQAAHPNSGGSSDECLDLERRKAEFIRKIRDFVRHASVVPSKLEG